MRRRPTTRCYRAMHGWSLPPAGVFIGEPRSCWSSRREQPPAALEPRGVQGLRAQRRTGHLALNTDDGGLLPPGPAPEANELITRIGFSEVGVID